jgi:hypothetical protein
MMQIEPFDIGDRVVLAPAIRGAVGAVHEQPVQYGEEDRALQRKAVLAFACSCYRFLRSACIGRENCNLSIRNTSCGK